MNFDSEIETTKSQKDIKSIQEKLNESNLRFKETSELLPAIICEIDLNLKFVYTNMLGLEMFGYTTEDLNNGIYMADLIPADELQNVKDNVNRALTGGNHSAQIYHLKHKDGFYRDYYVNSSPIIRNNVIVGLRSCLTDITPLKEAENRLQESEERFRKIYTGSPIGIAVCNSDMIIIDMNDSFKKMFCLTDKTTVSEFHFSLFEHIPFLKEKQKSIVAGNVFHCESDWDFVFTHIDNRLEIIPAGNRFLYWQITPLTDEVRGAIFLVQVQDISERKRKEEDRIALERIATEKAEKIVEELRKELSHGTASNNMISRSASMQKIFKILPEVSQTNVTVLIFGESGTGKEVIAKTIHELSSRKNEPFIAINCGALPDALLESELFGYKAGAFTDAKKDKIGKFQLAEGGTLFLDEIGETTQAMQVKLLRVIQERCFEPLGGVKSIKSNVRLIAATNRNLKEMVKCGSFREDLYYRIKVVTVELPPLRDRRSDIPLLIDQFIHRFNNVYKKNILEISKSALAILLAHNYAGNIRELEHILEHVFVFCKGSVIESIHLPYDLLSMEDISKSVENPFDTIRSFNELEKKYLLYIFDKNDGNKTAVANQLGIHRSTLFRKCKALGLEQFVTESSI